METTLALSISDQYKMDKTLLGSPISKLAQKAGLNVNQVYAKLIPQLAGKDFAEAIRYAEVAIKYAAIVDRNRLREECGIEFITALDQVMTLVKQGLDSKEHWILRKAIALHGQLIDESSEKQRFIESILTEKKIELLAKTRANIKDLESEIIDFEESKTGVFAIMSERA